VLGFPSNILQHQLLSMLFEEHEVRTRRSAMDRVNSNDDGLSRQSQSSRGSLLSHTSGESKSSSEDPATLKKVKKSKKEPPYSSESSKAKKGPKKGLTDQKRGHVVYQEELTREKEGLLGAQRLSDQCTGATEAFNDFVVDRAGSFYVADDELQSSNSTPLTAKTSTTMGSYERACQESFDEAVGGLPVRFISTHDTAHATNSGGVVPDPKEKKAMAAFHGEMLQSFLTRHGKDEKLAMEQAMMFEAFLKSQADISPFGGDKKSSPEPFQHDAAELNAIAQLKALELEDDEESRMEQAESLFGDDIAEGDSFAPDTAWDNGSFQSYPNIAVNKVDMDNSFGRMRRNETFVRHKSGDDMSEQKPRARNMVANAQARAMVSPPVPTMVSPPVPTMIGPPPFTYPQPHQIKSAEVTHRKVMAESHEMNRSDGRRSQSQQMPAMGLYDTEMRHARSGRRGSSGSESMGTVRSAPNTPVSKTTLSFEDQLNRLTVAQRSCVHALKTTWESGEGKSKPFPDLWYIKFAKCSPGPPYDYKSALKVMQKFDRRNLNLSIVTIESQLNARTIFPCPGLLSAEGHAVMYFRMSHFSPKKEPVLSMLDSLVYVMSSMMECEEVCTDGLSLVSNLTDFKMTNFSVAYFHKFIMALQGRKLPTRVNLWLLVNPPAWFGSIWQIMRPMMSEDFRSKVFRVSEKDMGQFMNVGYENFLPDDMKSGKANTDIIIRDYIAERRRLEGQNLLHYSRSVC
jgi:hypothetical protein